MREKEGAQVLTGLHSRFKRGYIYARYCQALYLEFVMEVQ